MSRTAHLPGRTKLSPSTSEQLGTLVLDSADDNKLAFVVPAAQLAGWDRLVVEFYDEDRQGYNTIVDKCTLTRL